MTELELMQESGVGSGHIGESRNTSALRELEALSKFLRANQFHDAASMTDDLQDFMRAMLQEDF